MSGIDKHTVLISGGSDGIGKAAAHRLHSAGANVAIVSRSEEKLAGAVQEIAEGSSERLLAISADCTDPLQIAGAYREAVDAFGPITALVNNVGSSVRGPFLEIGDDKWQSDLDLKLFAAIRFSRLVIPEMMRDGAGGRIVNVLSIGGKHPDAASVPTTVTRAAGLALTKALSKEFTPFKILTNAVCIGLVKSGQHSRRWEAKHNGESLDSYYADLADARKIPLGRFGEADEAAATIAFLLSDDAAFLSGASINVDGGASHVL